MNIACYIRSDTVLEQIRGVLARAGFGFDHFPTDTALLRAVRRRAFDLVLVDYATEVPTDDSILSWLNCRSGEKTPVLAVSPVRNADFIALVLNCGADDFVVRLFEPVELIEVVSITNQALVLRRQSPPSLLCFERVRNDAYLAVQIRLFSRA